MFWYFLRTSKSPSWSALYFACCVCGSWCVHRTGAFFFVFCDGKRCEVSGGSCEAAENTSTLRIDAGTATASAAVRWAANTQWSMPYSCCWWYEALQTKNKNGQQYSSIGRIMVRSRALKQTFWDSSASMQQDSRSTAAWARTTSTRLAILPSKNGLREYPCIVESGRAACCDRGYVCRLNLYLFTGEWIRGREPRVYVFLRNFHILFEFSIPHGVSRFLTALHSSTSTAAVETKIDELKLDAFDTYDKDIKKAVRRAAHLACSMPVSTFRQSLYIIIVPALQNK